ncbi:MAG: D-Ala-D-Ala carboxypeptidase family metallohydrolase [Ilumatobacteraceae bacterium]
MTYSEFLAGLQLRHFAPSEITSYAGRERNGISNSLPPEDLWLNIVPTLWVVDQLRHYFDAPITLTSIYRSPEYNSAVGGASQSEHMRNAAIDLQVKNIEPKDVFNRLSAMRAAGTFAGGLGLYPTFVHIDTRGRNATW